MLNPFSQSETKRRYRETALVSGLLAVSYVACAEVGHALSFQPFNFAAFWPPSGLLLAVLALSSRRQWLMYLAAGVAANFLSDVVLHQQQIGTSLGFCLANAVAAMLGASLLQRFYGVPFRLQRTRDVFGLAVFGAGIGMMASATIGALVVSWQFGRPFGSAWYLWWMGDMMGVLIVAPTIILTAEFSSMSVRLTWWRLAEALLHSLVLAVVCYFAFGMQYARPTAFYVFPSLIWAAFRFGRAGAAFATMIVAFATVISFVKGTGVFGATIEDVHQVFPHVQAFLITTLMTSMLFATAIEERQKAEVKHGERERMLDLLLENTTDAIFIKDTHGKYIIANNAVAGFVGKPVEQIVGRDDYELFDPATAAIFRQKDHDSIAAKKVETFEEVVQIHGDNKIFLATKGPLYGPHGNLIGTVGVSRDITEYRNALIALADEGRRFTALTDLSPAGIFQTNLDGDCLYVNPRWCELSGMTAEEAQGRGWLNAIHPEDRQLVVQEWQKTIENKDRTFNLEFRFQTPEGKVFWLIGTAAPLHDELNLVKGYIGNVLDITPFKETQESLRESDLRFRQMAEAITEAFFLRQIEPIQFLYMSPAYEQITGRTAQELYQNPLAFLEAVHPDDREQLKYVTMHPETIKEPVPFRVIRPDGAIRYIETRISMVADDFGVVNRLAGIALDITPQRIAEMELARKNEELEHHVAARTAELQKTNDLLHQANVQLQSEMRERNLMEHRLHEQQSQLAQFSRLSTIGEMGAELAHEINQPLHAIRNYLFGTLHNLSPGQEVSAAMIETLRDIEIEAERAAAVVRRIKNFVSRSDPQREPFPVAGLFQDVSRLTDHDAHMRGILVDFECDTNLPNCFGDPLQIQQVLVNLVRNAMDALTEDETPAPHVHVEAVQRSNCIEIAVHDNGPGLTKDAKERIFEPFFTTKPDGLGLGLSISKSIIEAHNGRLWVASRYPSGVSFYFEVPTAQGDALCPPIQTTSSCS